MTTTESGMNEQEGEHWLRLVYEWRDRANVFLKCAQDLEDAINEQLSRPEKGGGTP